MIDRKSISDLSIEMGYPVPSEDCFAMADKVHDVLCDLASCSVNSDDEGVINIEFPLRGKYSSVDIIDENGVGVWLFFNKGNVTELTDITLNWESILRGLFDK